MHIRGRRFAGALDRLAPESAILRPRGIIVADPRSNTLKYLLKSGTGRMAFSTRQELILPGKPVVYSSAAGRSGVTPVRAGNRENRPARAAGPAIAPAYRSGSRRAASPSPPRKRRQ